MAGLTDPLSVPTGRAVSVTRSMLALLLAAVLVASCGGSGATDDTTEGTTEAPGTTGADNGSTTVAGDGEWEPEYVDGVLQPLPDGFPDRPITLVSPDEAGTASGLFIRAVQQAINEAGNSPVEIRISDDPRATGGSVHALAEIIEEEGGMDGYFPISASVAGTATDFHTEPVTDETGLTFEDMNWFISTDQTPYVLISRIDAPWGTDFDAFVEYAREAGEDLRLMTQPGNFNAIAGLWMLDQFGIEPTHVPMVDRDAGLAAVGAGEADFFFAQPRFAIQGEGRVVVLWLSGYDVPEAFAGAGSLNDHAEYGAEELVLGTINAFLLHADVPADHVAWLHELISVVGEQESYLQREETDPGLVVKVTSVEETNEIARTAYEDMEQTIRDAGVHIDDAG